MELTLQQIEEGNTAIMLSPFITKLTKHWLECAQDAEIRGQNGIVKRMIKKAKFHQSWTDLMGVVQTIQAMDLSVFNYDVQRLTVCKAYQEAVLSTKVSAPIEELWQQVVDMCNWYKEHVSNGK